MIVGQIIRHLRTLVRAEAAVADIQTRRGAKRAVLVAFAFVLGLFAMAALSAAAFWALAPLWGNAWAAAAVGGAYVYLAAFALLAAHWTSGGRNLELASERRQEALARLADDGEAVIRTLEHPLSLLPALAIPLIELALSAATRPRAPASKDS